MNGNEIIENEIIDTEDQTSPVSEIITDSAEADALRSRISELEHLLEEQSSRSSRERREREEFCRIFPGIDPDALPDEVMLKKEAGVPLAAAYALYERIRQNELSAALEANRKNASSLNSSLSNGSSEAFFSADEVKKMDPRQVRDNFPIILRSMKHWRH